MPNDTDPMIEDIYRAVLDDDIDLTAWEDEFLQSIKGRERLTDKQDVVLERIWWKATGRSRQ